jgi:glycine/D-amino acid oxidase-like deaminating enzyme
LRTCRKIRGPVYSLPEKIIDVRSVLRALARNLDGRVYQGDLTEITADAEALVSGQRLRARRVVVAAGIGNELVLDMLGMGRGFTQRRPLRQILIRSLPFPLFAHAIGDQGRPRISVTSHSIGENNYVWYLGGAVAERAAAMDRADALRLARDEVEQIFPGIAWPDKEWATWYGDRAEPLDVRGELPAGPLVHQCGRVLVAWPTKLTFAPAISDCIMESLKDVDVSPESSPPPLPRAQIGCYPWEVASWQRME